MHRSVVGVTALALAAGMLEGCAVGNQAGALQVPAVVTGLVTATSACPPGSSACPGVVTTVPGAVVQAQGKDGTHEAVADANGHYQIALLGGEWTLAAQRSGASVTTGPSKRLDLSAGSSVVLNLEAGP